MLSIVIVHWNTPGLLANCLASIDAERRDEPNVGEVVVVDCASTVAGHREVIRRFPVNELIQMPANIGYAAGCNAGMRATTGDIVLFLNADTELTPGSLSALLDPFSLAPHIGLVAPLLLNVDGTIQSSGYRFPGILNTICDLIPVPARLYESSLNGRMSPGDGQLPYAVDYVLGAALAVRREAFIRARGLDESYGMYCEEIDFARRLEQAGWTRLIAPASEVVHIGGASTGQMPVEMRQALWRSRGMYHRRWDSPARRKALTNIVTMVRAARQGAGTGGRNEPDVTNLDVFLKGLGCRN